MKTNIRKFPAVLLLAVLCLTVFPISAMAAGVAEVKIPVSDPAAAGNDIITPMFIGRPGRRPLRPLHNHHFFIHSLTVKKLLPLIRQRTTRCTHSRSDKTHKSNPFLKIHSYLQFYDIPKLSSLSFLIVTSLLHEFYQKSTYFYTILQLLYSHHIRNSSTSATPG